MDGWGVQRQRRVNGWVALRCRNAGSERELETEGTESKDEEEKLKAAEDPGFVG